MTFMDLQDYPGIWDRCHPPRMAPLLRNRIPEYRIRPSWLDKGLSHQWPAIEKWILANGVLASGIDTTGIDIHQLDQQVVVVWIKSYKDGQPELDWNLHTIVCEPHVILSRTPIPYDDNDRRPQ